MARRAETIAEFYGENEGLSERELAALNGLSRVWDCVKIRWTKAISG